MRYICFLLLTAALTVSASENFFENPPLLALLKDNDTPTEKETVPPEKEKETEQAIRSWMLGARFGLFYPGPSSDTDDFITGPAAGGYVHIAAGPGTFEATLDITSLKAPSDVDKEYQLLFLAGTNYLFHLDKFHLGAGVTLANASPINEIFLFQATAGIHVRERIDITMNLYIPAGNPNNSFMIGLYVGYRF